MSMSDGSKKTLAASAFLAFLIGALVFKLCDWLGLSGKSGDSLGLGSLGNAHPIDPSPNLLRRGIMADGWDMRRKW